ncbi:hypothetical protein H1Q58_16000 [Planococcus maritimus]|uniref:DUF4309 domain-containing protein n=1 Tax=Planococcus maritimus TaxID=192421 RepID=A0A7D7MIE7_PLAMR|nr:hypothetical protein [Planococcus maritimus]QMT17428.1 hypothetical protein H1Q58_16000 [Planococcus maritimus]
MPKRKNVYQKSLSIGVLSSALLMAGCGTGDSIAENPATSEKADLATTASDGSGETEASEDDVETEEDQEKEEAEAETAATGEDEQVVPADQMGISMPLPLGTPLADLIEHYGQPTYDDYFLGSRLVVFNEEDGYFLDDQNVAKGFYIGNADISVFDTRIGMTFGEIDEILGAKGEVGYDESETQYYLNIHYVENYKITYSAETEDGPVVEIVIIRSK